MPDRFIDCDARELIAQIGMGNLLAISGGRVKARPTGVTLPVGNAYSVTVDLAADDLYVVRRIRRQHGRDVVLGELSGIFNDMVGEIAYQASCFVNRDFGEDLRE